MLKALKLLIKPKIDFRIDEKIWQKVKKTLRNLVKKFIKIIMENNKLLVDSSVIISALLSNRGASHYCLITAKDEGYKLFIPEFILKELFDVIDKKFQN